MTPTTPTRSYTGYLGRDVQIRQTTPRDRTTEVYDEIMDGMVTVERTTSLTDYARLSLAIHPRPGKTEWLQLRAFDLDHHPDEHRIRAARKGQRVEVEGRWEVHEYDDPQTGERREFRYFLVTSFRFRPGKRLTPKLSKAS